eukprot:c17165_g2_i2 orf=110-271(+)
MNRLMCAKYGASEPLCACWLVLIFSLLIWQATAGSVSLLKGFANNQTIISNSS